MGGELRYGTAAVGADMTEVDDEVIVLELGVEFVENIVVGTMKMMVDSEIEEDNWHSLRMLSDSVYY